MFGQNDQQVVDGSGLPPMDPGMMSGSVAQGFPAPQTSAAPISEPLAHPMTPAYPDSIQQTDTSEPAANSYIDTVTNDTVDVPHPVENELLEIKQQVLGSLAPLVGQLDQSAEEKFKTTMMMMQASDDHSLVRVAYEAAQGIEDPKVKAQALLDVVNEINYFLNQA
jgi:hypothetical protein